MVYVFLEYVFPLAAAAAFSLLVVGPGLWVDYTIARNDIRTVERIRREQGNEAYINYISKLVKQNYGTGGLQMPFQCSLRKRFISEAGLSLHT